MVPVPILYGDMERWKSIKNDGIFRDQNGQIQCPLIIYKRGGITKNSEISMNKIQPDNPVLYKTFTRKYSRNNQYMKNGSVINKPSM